jgi:hypothetical protein
VAARVEVMSPYMVALRTTAEPHPPADAAGTTEPHLRPGHGVRRTVTDPAGRRYLLRAARSGHVDWPVYAAQTVAGLVVQTLGTAVVNRLVFRGGWTVTTWRGDAIAPKRTKVCTSRYPTEAVAVAALATLAAEIERRPARG